MLNYDAAYLFTKVITIGNPIDNDVLTNVSYSTGAAANNQSTVNVKILYKATGLRNNIKVFVLISLEKLIVSHNLYNQVFGV